MDPFLAPRPQPLRRHSTAVPARRLSRPYRSSPLAGPALSPSGALAEHTEPPRVSSSPNLNTLPPLPVFLSEQRPRVRRATITAHSDPAVVNLARLAAEEKLSAHGEPVSRPSTSPAPSTATATSKRSSLSLRFSRRASYSPSASASASASSSSSSSPPSPVPDLPSRRRSIVVTPSTSRDPAENWLSATAAPKFSRLGLGADGVVLPVSAKAYTASVSSHRSRPSRPSSPTSVRSADSASSRSALSLALARRASDTSIDTSPPASTGSSSRSPRVHWSASADDDEGDATAITPAAVAPGKRPRPRPLRRAWNKLLLALHVPRVRAP